MKLKHLRSLAFIFDDEIKIRRVRSELLIDPDLIQYVVGESTTPRTSKHSSQSSQEPFASLTHSRETRHSCVDASHATIRRQRTRARDAAEESTTKAMSPRCTHTVAVTPEVRRKRPRRSSAREITETREEAQEDALNAQAEVLIKKAILEAEATLTRRHDSSSPTITEEKVVPNMKLRMLDFTDSTSSLASSPEATPAKLREPPFKARVLCSWRTVTSRD